jgi:hypothetical protein
MELSLHMKWVLLALLFCSDHVLALQSVSSRKHREVVSQAALTSLQAAQFATAHRSLLDSSGPIQDGLADSDNDCSWVEEYKQFHKEQRGAEGAKYLVFGCFNNQGKLSGWPAGGDASRVELIFCLHGQHKGSLKINRAATSTVVPASTPVWLCCSWQVPRTRGPLQGHGVCCQDCSAHKEVWACLRHGGLCIQEPCAVSFLR